LRRPTFFIAAALAGLAAALLAAALDIAPGQTRFGTAFPLGSAAYLALVAPAGGWWSLAARDRKARFRIFPLLRSAAAGGLLALALPFPQPWGVCGAVLTAVVTQVASPWNKQAADYARYAARAAKARRKGAAA
jgi:hypothetical protein